MQAPHVSPKREVDESLLKFPVFPSPRIPKLVPQPRLKLHARLKSEIPLSLMSITGTTHKVHPVLTSIKEVRKKIISPEMKLNSLLTLQIDESSANMFSNPQGYLGITPKPLETK
jgi:hypothetical protein